MSPTLPETPAAAAPPTGSGDAELSGALDEPIGDPATGHRGGPRRRRWVLAAAGLVAVAAVAGGVVVTRDRGGDGVRSGSDAATSASLATATVERRDLEEHAELGGTLGYGEVTDVSLTAEGTITGLAPVGTTVGRGQSLLEVDGRPVPLLVGTRPLWRELGPDVDDGADVQQLEANLVALGIVSASELTVDTDWTGATTAAVKEWQDSIGVDDTGTISPGQVVFLPGAVRVAEHPTPVGGSAAGPVLGVTSSTRVVTVDLEANRQSLVQEGQAVDIELPDGTVATGKVQSIGNVAATGDSSSDEGGDPSGGDGGGDEEATIEVVVALDDPAATGANLDQAPVTVQVVTSAAEGVLAVPVEALVVLAGGDYAVEVAEDDGTRRPIPVELGAFADGWVEVTGDLAEGDEVVVPDE